MALILAQVTLGAGATPLSSSRLPALQVTLQNNAGHNMRVGDSTVSSTKGALLSSGSPGGSANFGPFPAYQLDLAGIYVYGTAADVVDVAYVI